MGVGGYLCPALKRRVFQKCTTTFLILHILSGKLLRFRHVEIQSFLVQFFCVSGNNPLFDSLSDICTEVSRRSLRKACFLLYNEWRKRLLLLCIFTNIYLLIVKLECSLLLEMRRHFPWYLSKKWKLDNRRNLYAWLILKIKLVLLFLHIAFNILCSQRNVKYDQYDIEKR